MTEFEVVGSREGALVSIRVLPRSRREGFSGVSNGLVKIAVTAPPADGAANKALIKFLSKELKVAKTTIEIVSGAASRQKRLRFVGLSAEDLQGRICERLQV